METQLSDEELEQVKKKKETKISWKLIKKQKFLIFMSLPFVIWLIIFKYLPLAGWMMAFQDYKPGKSIFNQTWVGFKHFNVLFKEPQFYQSLQNTLGMSILGLVFGTISAIGFALLLNELKNAKFKKTIQTISYLPHFISWVAAASTITSMLAPSGAINELLIKFHIISEPMQFMSDPNLFWGIVTSSDIISSYSPHMVVGVRFGFICLKSALPQLLRNCLHLMALQMDKLKLSTLHYIKSNKPFLCRTP